ncbi:MAG: hypothetical protein JWN61_3062 [Pseudonocardiales bacterium]|nr:hypothetical protein [Pseudonocardiales bacterium]
MGGAEVGAVHEAPALALPPATLYNILRLRSEVFVVEQECAYVDIDGRDLEERAVQLWIARDGQILATLRLLWDGPRAARIGRVATATSARSAGLAARLMERALKLAEADRAETVVLDAQARLEPWYARFGFVRSGPNFLEDNIDHVPMTRTYADQHGL